MKKLKLSTVLLYLFLILGAMLMVFLFYWMISGSLKTSEGINTFPPQLIPTEITLRNYRFALETAPFGRYFLNSVLAAVSSVTLCTMTTILAAFAFSRLRFVGRVRVFGWLLAMMMVPFEMVVITNYRTIVQLGLHNRLIALIIPFTSSIFYTYILKNFFDSIPDSLYQAARVDGCSNWRFLWRVMVPIARPSLFTIILLNTIASWNSFMWPMLATNSKNVRTLPFGLYTFVTEGGARNEIMMAASTIVVLPMILLFLVTRKNIVNGVARGGLKG